MADYDEQILMQFADQLYSQARAIVISTAVLYGLIAMFVGFVGSAAMAAANPRLEVPIGAVTGVVTILGVLIGVSVGNRRAFHLRLEAQRLLVQLQIERNTR
jgi:uncharacterized integral membrane protein